MHNIFAITFEPSSTSKPLHTHAFMLAGIQTYLLVQEVFLFKDKDIFSDSPPKIMACYTLTNKALKQNNNKLKCEVQYFTFEYCNVYNVLINPQGL